MSTVERELEQEAPAEPVWPRLAKILELIRKTGLAQGRLEDEHGQFCFYGAMRHLGYYIPEQTAMGHPVRPYGSDLKALARACIPHEQDGLCVCFDCSYAEEPLQMSRDVCWSIITEANDSLPEARWLETIERVAYGL